MVWLLRDFLREVRVMIFQDKLTPMVLHTEFTGRKPLLASANVVRWTRSCIHALATVLRYDLGFGIRHTILLLFSFYAAQRAVSYIYDRCLLRF
jgi:hypothetical protein